MEIPGTTLKTQYIFYISGPSCSKLTISLNVSLKLRSINMAYTLIFLLKNVGIAFAYAKATHIFSAKMPVNKILY